MCILGAAPFAACGFFTYHGMTAEQVLWAWFKSEILCPKRLVFKSDSYYYEAMQPAMLPAFVLITRLIIAYSGDLCAEFKSRLNDFETSFEEIMTGVMP